MILKSNTIVDLEILWFPGQSMHGRKTTDQGKSGSTHEDTG